MCDRELRERIIFLYWKKKLNVSDISWILDISRKDVKKALFDEETRRKVGNMNV